MNGLVAAVNGQVMDSMTMVRMADFPYLASHLKEKGFDRIA
jgi:hypothetical protein